MARVTRGRSHTRKSTVPSLVHAMSSLPATCPAEGRTIASCPLAGVAATIIDPPYHRTSLESPESNPQYDIARTAPPDLSVDACTTFRHSGWQHDRQRVAHALHRTEQPFNQQYDFSTCGLYAYVLQSIDDPTKYRVAGSCCHNRFCRPCGTERSHAMSQNIVAHLDGRPARFITLTLRSTTESLATLLDKLQDCFGRLRRRAIWRKRVTGGVALIELKWTAELQRWHVHLHCIVTGRYIKQSLLSQQWLAITRDSLIVDIRMIKDGPAIARYVTKYASKPLSHTVILDPDRLDEAILALKGRRLATTFGSWRGLLLSPKPDPKAWINLGSLASMIRQAESGEPIAVAICQSLSVVIVPTVTTSAAARAPPATSVGGGDQRYLNLNYQPLWIDVG